jgi:hypothetical protein
MLAFTPFVQVATYAISSASACQSISHVLLGVGI